MKRLSYLFTALLTLIILPGSLPLAAASSPTRTIPLIPAACRTIIAPALAYARNGSVYRVDPTGHNACRLTQMVGAKEPRLSPDGRRVAFLAGVGSHGDGRSNVNTVRVARVGGPVSSGTVVPVGRGLHGQLAWSPDAQKLAFTGQSGVWVWRATCGCVRLAVLSKGSTLQASFAWSPDSRRLAAYLLPALPTPTSTRLTLHVADLTTGTRSTITVTFPSWLTGSHAYSGSYPSGIVAWLPSGTLLLRTSGWGLGVNLTSLWLAPWIGGMARMIVGTPFTRQHWLKYPLLNSSQALVSPDGSRLLLDPNRALWIGSTRGGGERTIELPIYGSCALSQIAWVGNGHVAYVTVCSMPGEGAIPILARLYILSLTGNAPTQAASAQSTQQDTLSIEAPTRCIACGAG